MQPPTPVAVRTNHRLKCVSLTTRPLHRRLDLDCTEGVKTWAVRLGRDETSVHVSGVKVLRLGQEDEESSDEEHEQDAELEEEDEEEEEKPKVKRGRGRPRKHPLPEPAPAKSPKSKGKGKAPAKRARPHEELQVKLNGVAMKESQKGEWDVDLPVGINTLEVSVRGGIPWKVYMERVA